MAVDVHAKLTAAKGEVEALARWRPYDEKPTLTIGLFPRDVPSVRLNTHMMHYGSSVFEGIRFYKTRDGRTAIFRLDEHVDRMMNGIQALLPKDRKLAAHKFPLSRDALKQLIIETVSRSGLEEVEEGYIRPLAGWGEGKLGVAAAGNEFIVSVTTMPWGKYLAKDAVHVFASRVLRKTPFPQLKIGGAYHAGMIAHFEAAEKGADEAVLLNQYGEVAEGSGENLFLVDREKKTLYTAPVKEGEVLPGITRSSVIKFAKEHGLKVEERPLTIADVARADELFFTGTAAEITAIAKFSFNVRRGRVDIRDESRPDSPYVVSLLRTRQLKRALEERGVRWTDNGRVDIEFGVGGTGPVTRSLKNHFDDIKTGGDPKYRRWLKIVEPAEKPVSFASWENKGWFSGVKVRHYQSPGVLEAARSLREEYAGMRRIFNPDARGLGKVTEGQWRYRERLLGLKARDPEELSMRLQALAYLKRLQRGGRK